MATKTEVERLGIVETKVDILIDSVKTIDDKIDKLDKKFAAKWVQTIVSGFVAAVLLAVAYALIHVAVPDNSTPISTNTSQEKPSNSSSALPTNVDSTPTKPTSSESKATATSQSNEKPTTGVVDQVLKVIP